MKLTPIHPKLRKGSIMHWAGHTQGNSWYNFPEQDITVLSVIKGYSIITNGKLNRQVYISCYMTGYSKPKWRETLIYESELSKEDNND